jgi:hypothetical protein
MMTIPGFVYEPASFLVKPPSVGGTNGKLPFSKLFPFISGNFV